MCVLCDIHREMQGAICEALFNEHLQSLPPGTALNTTAKSAYKKDLQFRTRVNQLTCTLMNCWRFKIHIPGD